MKPYVLKMIVPVLVAIGATGCKLGVTQHLYVADLVDVVRADEERLDAPLSLRIPIESTEKCDEAKAAIQRAMSGLKLDKFLPRQCERERWNSYLIADALVPVERYKYEGFVNLSVFNVWVDQRADGMHVFLVVDRAATNVLEKRLSDEFENVNVDLSDSVVRVELSNDLREPVTVEIADVFLDGDPVYGLQEYEIGRRGTMRIRLSDVGAAALMKYDAIGFMIIKKSFVKS